MCKQEKYCTKFFEYICGRMYVDGNGNQTFYTLTDTEMT